ncbi:polyamine transporter 2 [Magnaporthiopsis poae ATCC 64411]|uniref:Polyamine transporter 2 n=1 Tax=Magnaporthiopsis poae (strain ATCC 64411 / 73-15) TaxID=644358 RepID=A0A0C4DLI8_MAGP6|nr:polyamine transporter 2 [Magnaporthiopsis poae ATCC 64411]
MNELDRELSAAEREASPELYNSRASHEIERVLSASSVSTTSSDGSSVRRSRAAAATAAPVNVGMSRVSTQADLERHPTELSRINTARSQHSATVGRSIRSRESRKPLPAFGAGKPFPPPLPDREEYVVEFDGPDDPLHAQNWPLNKKLATAAMLGYTTMTAAFASSIFSAATRAVAAEYGVSTEVGLLGVSFFVLGFAFGPTLWAPLSELKGRRLPIVVSMFGFTLFSIATATGKDIQTILICRFFSGFFGACPLAVVAAVFSDMFDNRTRGIAITLFSMAVFSGPLMSPFIGGFMVESSLGWRWTMYLTSIMGFIAFMLDLFFLEETYPPIILVAKAAELRRRTLNWGIHAKQEEIEIDLRELISKNFSRPMRLLFFEPIVTSLSVYMAFIYGLLYLFLTAYPFVFQGVYHFSSGIAGLAFFGMIIGQFIAGITVLLQQPWYNRKLAANNGVPIPEWRLPSVVAGGVAFTIGIFFFGFSSRADVHWIVPMASGLFTGFGLMSIFLQALNYLVDAYLMFAASAIAGNTFLRSLCGACFPLFAGSMFNGMGVQWASLLLGCLAAAMIPIPVIFWLYGHKIRARSAFAPTPPVGQQLGSTGSRSTPSIQNQESEKETLPPQTAGANTSPSGAAPVRRQLDKAEAAV